jgi:microcystin degradation protein MlrC
MTLTARHPPTVIVTVDHMPTLAIARVLHEGNSFSPLQTPLTAFTAHEWHEGASAHAAYRGTNTELGGAIAWLDANPDWQPVFLRCTGAPSSGVLAPGVFDAIAAGITDALAARRFDAVYLSLHGSLNAAEYPEADFELLRRVRAAIGDTVLAASFDLHANVRQEEADLLDIAVGYKCHPHTDMPDTAIKALGLMARCVRKEIRPVSRLVKTGAILPSLFARTTDGPMAEVKRIAAAIEARAGLLDLTPYQGYAYADNIAAGATAWATADGDASVAQRAAEELAAVMNMHRDGLFRDLPSAAEGIASALARIAAGEGPVAVVDSADHTGAGGIGDTPGLLAALVAAKPSVPSAFAFFHDPALVARANEAGPGARLDVSFGGRLTALFGPPVRATVTVGHLSDGRFRNVGPVYGGLDVDLEGCARLDFVDLPIQVLVTGRCADTTDPDYWRVGGIDLAAISLVAAKAKNQFRACFGGHFRHMIDIDSPGPAAYDFSCFPFRHAERTLFPLSR